MVFFVCDACGQSFKKNQVEKHLRGCRKCQFMSCLDCNQEFWGDDYKAHIKCISEDQKYGGKNYKPKTSSNKGENKQNDWMELIREVISTSNVKPHLVHVMQEIVQQPNLPRKQAKFEKFLQNSLRHKNPEILNEAWNIFSKAQEKIKSQKGDNNQQVVNETEVTENSKRKINENGGVKENTVAEGVELNDLQFNKRKGKPKIKENESNSYQVKEKNQETTEVLESQKYQGDKENGIEIFHNSNMQAELKREKSHKKKVKSKLHQSYDNENIVSVVSESVEVPDFSMDIKKKNKKRKHVNEENEAIAIDTMNVVSDSSMLVKKKNKKRKRDVEESEGNAIQTSPVVSNVTESIAVSESIRLPKKKNKKRKRENDESEAIAIEISNAVSDVTESIAVSNSSVLIKKKNKKQKHDKESEANAIETLKNSKFEIPKQDILGVKDSQVDVTIPKKKKKKYLN